MVKRRIVVTGVGMLTPLGVDCETSWLQLTKGKSGIKPITSFDVSNYSVRFAGAVPDFDVEPYISNKESRRMDGFIRYAIVAGIQAMEDAALEISDENRHRVGVAVGSGIGGIASIEECHEVVLSKGPTRVNPFFVPASIINMAAGHLSIIYGLKGPNVAITTACTTGTHNVGFGARMIAYGDADAMLVGSAEKSTCPTTVAGFAAMRALSTRNDAPELASRPWDQERDGFVLSDGAAVLLLEEYEHAKKRGAEVYCELVGFGMSADASHMTQPSESGEGAAMSMRNALNDAEVCPDEIDYINAHGTSTPLGDVAETLAVKSVFGIAAGELAISSTKSMIGHALGAAGSVEAAITVMSIKHQVAPPTINLDNPEAGCDLDYIPHTARDMRIKLALSNSFGFGGTNGSLIFRQVS